MKSMNTAMIWIFVKDNIKFLPRKYQLAKLEFDRVYFNR